MLVMRAFRGGDDDWAGVVRRRRHDDEMCTAAVWPVAMREGYAMIVPSPIALLKHSVLILAPWRGRFWCETAHLPKKPAAPNAVAAFLC
jgi:hypothetical protein